MKFFSKAFISFGGVIKIFAFDWDKFIILVIHDYKVINFTLMILIVCRFLIPKGYRGMAVFPFVILRHADDAETAVLINHEKIHIRQQLEMLVVPFFVWYFAEYLYRLIQFHSHAAAYKNISFEREAYANEKSPDYLKSRPFWRFIKYF